MEMPYSEESQHLKLFICHGLHVLFCRHAAYRNDICDSEICSRVSSVKMI